MCCFPSRNYFCSSSLIAIKKKNHTLTMTDPEHWVYGLDHTRALFFTIAQASAAGATLWLILPSSTASCLYPCGFCREQTLNEMVVGGNHQPCLHEAFKDCIFFPVQDAIWFSASRWGAAGGLLLVPTPPPHPIIVNSSSTSQGACRDEGSTNVQTYIFHFYTEELEK